MRLVVVVALAGCGRLNFDAHASDGSGELPWSAPSVYTLAKTGDDPSLTADLLEMYINVSSATIYATTRATTADAWAAPALQPDLADPGSQSTPELSADGLTIYISSARAGSLGQQDIWMATRATRMAPWGNFVDVTELSSPQSEHPGCTSGDGLLTVFDSNRKASTDDDLYMSTRATTADPWGAPVELAALDVDGFNDESPCVSADGLTLYFDSNRAGTADLYVSHRATRADPFADAVPIAELNTSSGDYDPWISPDDHDLVFFSAGQVRHATR